MTKATQETVKKQSTHKRNTSGLIPFKPGPDARRNMKGPNIKAFRDLSKLALEKGNELAYTPAGKPIIWNGKHLTFAEFVIMSWLSDKKFMHEWRDTAVGKVAQSVEMTGKDGQPLPAAQIVTIYIPSNSRDDKPKE